MELSLLTNHQLYSYIKKLKNIDYEKTTILKVGPYSIRFITDDEDLYNLSIKNFKESKSQFFDATICSYTNKSFIKGRYYNSSLKTILHINCHKYEYFKMSYRTLSTELGLSKKIVALHSTCLIIENKAIIIWGRSGSGKTTLMTELINSNLKKIQLLWDDWGFYDLKKKKLISSNEYHSYIKKTNLHLYCKNKNLKDYDEQIRKNSNRIMLKLTDFKFDIKNNNNIKSFYIIIITPSFRQSVSIIDIKPALRIVQNPFYNNFLEKNVFYFNGAIPKNKNKFYNAFYKRFLGNSSKIIHLQNNYKKFNIKKILMEIIK